MIKAIFVIVFSLYSPDMEHLGETRVETVVPSMAICEQMKQSYVSIKSPSGEEDWTVGMRINIFCNTK